MDTDPPLSGLLYFLDFHILATLSTSGLIVILLVLLFGSALFSASEVAFFSLSHKDMEKLNKSQEPVSQRIENLKKRPRELLATILLANNFINIAIVILSDILIRNLITESTLLDWSHAIQGYLNMGFISDTSLSHVLSFLITIIGVTFLLVLFGEVAPKIYANLNNLRHARLMAGSLLFLTKVFSPINMLLIGWSNKFEERVYTRRMTTHSSTDKKELDKAIMLTVSEDGHREDIDILKGIIKFGDVVTKQIMKSRMDVVAIDITHKFSELMEIIKTSGFSRIPVYQDDFDNIQGILYVKDLLGHSQEDDTFEWTNLIRSNVLYVPETKKIDELLKEFQRRHTHMAIVVDEYGGSSGIVTLEDIMEEVVGDIKDEFDQEEEVDYTKIDDHNFIFEGKTLLNDVARITGIDSDVFNEGRGAADSLGGMIIELQGKIPKRDRVINYKGLRFKIVSVNKKRVEKINITL